MLIISSSQRICNALVWLFFRVKEEHQMKKVYWYFFTKPYEIFDFHFHSLAQKGGVFVKNSFNIFRILWFLWASNVYTICIIWYYFVKSYDKFVLPSLLFFFMNLTPNKMSFIGDEEFLWQLRWTVV